MDTLSKLKKVLPELETEVFALQPMHLFPSLFRFRLMVHYHNLRSPDSGMDVLILIFVFFFSKVRRPTNFGNFYSYAFSYCLTGMMPQIVYISNLSPADIKYVLSTDCKL